MEKKVRSVNGIETNNQVGYFNWQEFELKKKRMGFARAKFITVYGGGYGGFFGGILWGYMRLVEWGQANDGTNL